MAREGHISLYFLPAMRCILDKGVGNYIPSDSDPLDRTIGPFASVFNSLACLVHYQSNTVWKL